MATTERELRTRIASIVKDQGSATRLSDICDSYAMPSIDREATSDDKRGYVLSRLDKLNYRAFLKIAESVAERCGTIPLQEELYELSDKDLPPLSNITRTDIADCYVDESMSGSIDLLDFIRRFWPIDVGDFFSDHTPAKEIFQHAIRNDDWSVADLLNFLSAEKWSRRRFLKLIQASIAPDARRGKSQDDLIERLRPVLARDRWSIEPDGSVSGYPSYKIVPSTSGVSGKPKNLIFAAIGPKPELGFSDAVSNDIVILENADKCLIYDRPFRDHGLLWNELVSWWQEQSGAAKGEEVGKALAARLFRSLDSEAEKLLFKEYFRAFRLKLGENLPALIPQVYLHYDPKTIGELKGTKRFPRQRMDFLLLFPHGIRIVLEVDGKHHYAEEEIASISRYAEMVSADRKLRILGYELYRFGANELVGNGSSALIGSFFEDLLRKHRLLR